jgi:polyisoprenoid-binding protein YceI
MTKSIVSALCLAALAATMPLGAQPAMQKPGSKSVAAITAGTYKVDPGHTLVTWHVDHMGFTPYTGIFGDVTGTLELDPKRPAAAKVDVTIPVAKITTANAALTAHLLRAPKDAGGKPDFFGADPAPAHFVSTGVKLLGKDRAAISGTLTLNGVTRPVVLDTVFYGAGKMPAMMGGGDGIGFTARATIKRSDFGLGFGVPMVSDAVALDIAAGFMK